jgi:hypothetical protein
MQLRQTVRNNPNATVGAGGGFLAVFVAWLGGNVFGWQISAEDGAIIATAITTVALVIGRNGIRGLVRIVWVGKQAAEQPEQPPVPTSH